MEKNIGTVEKKGGRYVCGRCGGHLSTCYRRCPRCGVILVLFGESKRYSRVPSRRLEYMATGREPDPIRTGTGVHREGNSVRCNRCGKIIPHPCKKCPKCAHIFRGYAAVEASHDGWEIYGRTDLALKAMVSGKRIPAIDDMDYKTTETYIKKVPLIVKDYARTQPSAVSMQDAYRRALASLLPPDRADVHNPPTPGGRIYRAIDVISEPMPGHYLCQVTGTDIKFLYKTGDAQ